MGWLAAIMVTLTISRNPFYMGLTLLWITLVTLIARAQTPAQPDMPSISPVRFGLLVITMSALFNALTVHIGATVLFSLPDAIPLIGGPITLEALVYGALNGVVIAGLFAAFAVINLVVPVRALIRIIPRAYYSVAVVISIAVTFVPTTLRQLRQIREAQAVRGHRMRGVRSWLPLVMPLLVGGLERALQLAEAMMARGFAGGESPASPGDDGHAKGRSRSDSFSRLALIGGLIFFLAGWLLRLVWQMPLLGLLFLFTGAALIVGALWVVGRRHPHTVHRPAPWTARDWAVITGAALTMTVMLVPLPGLDRSSIFYYPYPRLTLPGFNPVIAAATWGLLAPAAVMMVTGEKQLRREPQRRRREPQRDS